MYREDLKVLEQKFKTNFETGLPQEQIDVNRQEFGANELESKKKQSLFVKFLLQFKDILIIILLIAAAVSIVIDPHEWFESLIILVVVVINAILGVYQENKAEKSLEALKQLSSPTCKAYRNGKLDTINTADLVVGDIVVVEAGDFIPADCRIIECTSLQVDESALTGESVAVTKTSNNITEEVSGLGDQKNMLFSSTYATNGKAKAVVVAVGMKTEIGKIAHVLLVEEDTLTPLQHKLEQVGKVIGFLAIGICVIVFIMEKIAGMAALDAFKTAVALAVAAIPEGLATVVTIVLAIGVEKMAKKNAVVKKMPAVETLGSTSVVCSDKTGTLTQNRMTVVKVYQTELKEPKNLTEDEKRMLQYFAICCDASVQMVDGVQKRIGDPTELALLDVNLAQGYPIEEYTRLLDIPFDSDRKLMTTVIKVQNQYVAITKGAPDVIFDRSVNETEEAVKTNQFMAESALRVLALAIKVFNYLPKVEELEQDLQFIGLVGMIDPAREEVKEAIKLAKAAHVKTVMITGDHIVTAKAIAKELGIIEDNQLAITSKELDGISDEYLEQHIDEYRVFARVAPKDKVRIVDAWQKQGAVVAMTGDGVNDAPALKRADIGCAMGITGTDVAKEAAEMVLMDDNFATIIDAVKQGRGIYSNIRKCVNYLLSSNIGEVLIIFVASIISLFLQDPLGVPLLPIHLLWINLITDSLPAFGLGMEEPEDSVMKDKPRDKKESFFANKLGLLIVFEGVLIGGLSLAAYLIGHFASPDTYLGQTMAFMTLCCCQLVHAYNKRTEHSIFSKGLLKNKFMNFAFLVGLALQLIVIYVPGVNDLFKVTALDAKYLLICIGLSLVTVVFSEILKAIKK